MPREVAHRGVGVYSEYCSVDFAASRLTMTDDATLNLELEGPSEPPSHEQCRSQRVEIPHLVLLWYWRDPSRVGEVAAVPCCSVLGRAPAEGRPVSWVRQRPGCNEPRPLLDDRRLSRLQLELRPSADAVVVLNRGRRELLVDGVPMRQASARRGAVLTVKDVAVLMLEWRERTLPPGRYLPAVQMSFEFGKPDAAGIIGECPVTWRLREQLAEAARAGEHTLIYGETGTGKELAARSIHLLSERCDGALVSRNAATIPESLFDAELFGNAKNYPNAGMPERVGLVGEAHGGTLILDEVGELTEERQAHLLRVLDAGGEYQRLGESRARRSDFRMVALTNRPLGCLKHDFLARFAVRIEMPRLRDRRADIPLAVRALWSDWFRSRPADLERFTASSGCDGPLLEPRLVELLAGHAYPENYRELRRLFRLAVFTSDAGYVGATRALLAEMEPKGGPRELDRQRVEAALERHRGRPTDAARELGLKNRFALYRAMQRLGVQHLGHE